jgi:hypothetical protein
MDVQHWLMFNATFNNISILSMIFKFCVWSLHTKISNIKQLALWFWFGLWCLTSLSTIFQLYCASQCYWWRKPEKTTDLLQVTDKLYHIMLIEYTLPWTGFKLTTLVVIGSDCTGSYKFNYHAITVTTSMILT